MPNHHTATETLRGEWPKIESTGHVMSLEQRELDARRHIADELAKHANTLWCLNDREASKQCWRTARTIRQTIALLGG